MNELHARRSDIKILVFSGLTNFEAVRHALQSGVQGYLEKGVELDEFPRALNAVRDGDYYVSPVINQHLRRIVRQSLRDPLLDRTEMEVLRLFAEGVPIKAIADEVELSQSGVYKVITRLRARVGSGDDRDMRDYAAKLGLSRGPHGK